MKVLVADKFPERGLADLRESGYEVEYAPELDKGTLPAAVKQSASEVLIVRSTEVTGDTLRAGRLAVVVRAGAGYNTIDVKTASELGIYVSNCPGKNSVAVAELAMGLILSLDRQIPDGVADLRRGVWNKTKYSKARGVFGRTLGLLGTGAIGRELAARAHAFGMGVVAWSRSLTEGQAGELGVVRLSTPVEVAAAADVVSVHLALKPETRGMLGAGFFGAMKPGAFFINTARAELVDEVALLEAVRLRNLRVAVDVFSGEPKGGTGAVESELLKEPGVYGTHHIGASTEQAQDAIAEESVRIAKEYKTAGRVPNCVNIALRTPATHLLVVRHFDRVGVLAHVFGQLKDAGINVEETENIVFEGATAAIARIQVDRDPDPATLEAIRAGSRDVIEISVVGI